MSQASNIPLPAPIRASGNLAVEWKRFKGQWNNYVVAAKLHREEKACQAAILLACIGANAYEIYTTLDRSISSNIFYPLHSLSYMFWFKSCETYCFIVL